MQLGSGNGTSFPTSVDTATTEVNAPASGKTKARAEVANDHSAAIIAIETSLTDGTIDDWTTKYPSVQSVVTESREIATDYQNTTGRPMYVAVCLSSDTLAVVFQLKTDSDATPTTIVSVTNEPVATYGVSVHGWVLAGNYYRVAASAGITTLLSWTEWY